MRETEQSKRWTGEFGKDYTNRNPHSVRDLEALYLKNFGITRGRLNQEFLENIPKDAKILEVGSNLGVQLSALKQAGFTNLTGIEVQDYAVKIAKERDGDINYIVGTALDLPFEDNSFDLVFTSGVLIHISPKDLSRVIDEIYRVTKRYIWIYEYLSEDCKEISYRNNENLAWKNDFMKLFLERYPDLKIIREKKLSYLDDENVDHMFLLEKKRTLEKGSDIEYCKKCAMPNTRPGSVFNFEGVCQACINYEKRKFVNWEERKEELRRLCNKYRKTDGSYDCIIPVSGGKDSYFLVHTLVNEMNMHPLLVTVSDSFTHTNAGIHNLRNLIEEFKLNHYQYTLNHDLFRRVTRIAFEETGEALRFIEYALYTIPTLFAQKFDIPFVVYGENSAYEYGTTSKEFYLANSIVESMSNRLEKDRGWWIEKGLTSSEVSSIQLDKTKPLPEVVYMSYFHPWSSVTNLNIARKYGFRDLANEWEREGYIENFEQIDSIAYMIGLWLKYPKFGFQRISDIASRRVREGLLSLEEAKKLIKENDHKIDQRAMYDFIEFLGYSPKQFWDIVEKHWNQNLFEKTQGTWRLKKRMQN